MARTSARCWSAPPGSPAQYQATPQTFFRCSSAGNGSAGGTDMGAKNAPISRGRVGRNSRYHDRISAARSIGNSVGPAATMPTGCSRKLNSVTMAAEISALDIRIPSHLPTVRQGAGTSPAGSREDTPEQGRPSR